MPTPRRFPTFPLSPHLFERFEQELRLRNYSPKTIKVMLPGLAALRRALKVTDGRLAWVGLAALTELRDGGAQAVHDRLRELPARVQVLEELGP